MSFEISGKIIELYDTQQVSDSFRKREFVVEKNESVGDRVFTDFIKFQVVQDRCDILNNFQVGDEVKVTFNIKGRKWEKDGKINYFSNLEAWRIEKQAMEGVDESPMPSTADMPIDSGNSGSDSNDADDLPF